MNVECPEKSWFVKKEIKKFELYFLNKILVLYFTMSWERRKWKTHERKAFENEGMRRITECRLKGLYLYLYEKTYL